MCASRKGQRNLRLNFIVSVLLTYYSRRCTISFHWRTHEIVRKTIRWTSGMCDPLDTIPWVYSHHCHKNRLKRLQKSSNLFVLQIFNPPLWVFSNVTLIGDICLKPSHLHSCKGTPGIIVVFLFCVPFSTEVYKRWVLLMIYLVFWRGFVFNICTVFFRGPEQFFILLRHQMPCVREFLRVFIKCPLLFVSLLKVMSPVSHFFIHVVCDRYLSLETR